MTESVHMPLTGICTPLPKQDSLFRFPSNVNEKVQEYKNLCLRTLSNSHLVITYLYTVTSCNIYISKKSFYCRKTRKCLQILQVSEICIIL